MRFLVEYLGILAPLAAWRRFGANQMISVASVARDSTKRIKAISALAGFTWMSKSKIMRLCQSLLRNTLSKVLLSIVMKLLYQNQLKEIKPGKSIFTAALFLTTFMCTLISRGLMAKVIMNTLVPILVLDAKDGKAPLRNFSNFPLKVPISQTVR